MSVACVVCAHWPCDMCFCVSLSLSLVSGAWVRIVSTLSVAADANTNGEATTCGRILIALSWVLVLCTMPLSLFVCFKVGEGVVVGECTVIVVAFCLAGVEAISHDTMCSRLLATGGAGVRASGDLSTGPPDDRRRKRTR